MPGRYSKIYGSPLGLPVYTRPMELFVVKQISSLRQYLCALSLRNSMCFLHLLLNTETDLKLLKKSQVMTRNVFLIEKQKCGMTCLPIPSGHFPYIVLNNQFWILFSVFSFLYHRLSTEMAPGKKCWGTKTVKVQDYYISHLSDCSKFNKTL